MVQRHEDTDDQIESGSVIDDTGTYLDGILIGIAGQIEDAAHGLRDDVIAGAVGEGACLAEPTHGSVQDGGVDLPDSCVVDPEFCGDTRFEVLHDEVCVPDQIEEHRLALRVLQIERHALFAAVEDGEVFAFSVCFIERAPGPRLVACRRFYFDDLRTVIRQDHGAERAAHRGRQVDHFQSVKWFCHGMCPPMCTMIA